MKSFEKANDSMLEHHHWSISANEPAESQCDPNDISDPVPSAGGGIQYDTWIEHN